MRTAVSTFIIAMLLLITGCTQTQTIIKYQCENGAFADSAQDCLLVSCPKNDCSVCPKPVEVQIVKYQCADGTIKNNTLDCPVITSLTPVTPSDYESSKQLINQKQRHGVFEFTVTYAGYDASKYKVEFEVKNTGSESEYFQPSAIAILDADNNQYDVGYSSDYPVSTMSNTILPGVTKKGYWLFENVPRGSGPGKFTFEIGFMDKSTFSYNVPLT